MCGSGLQAALLIDPDKKSYNINAKTIIFILFVVALALIPMAAALNVSQYYG